MSKPKITLVELTNFKSFEGTHVLGPFSNFCCVIGPNGAGKSNALDAILFALFLDPNPRTTNYIHKNLLTDQYVSDSCEVSVQLEFKGEKTSFKRVYYDYEDDSEHVNREEYFKDDEELDKEAYLEAIRSLHIIPLAVIKQTEVDTVARYTPMELTKLFEEMSGSAQYAKEYDTYKLKSESNREQLALLEKRKRVAISEQKHISFRKDEAEQYRSDTKDEQKFLRESTLFQIFHAKRQLDYARDEFAALQRKKDETLSTQEMELKAQIQKQQSTVNDKRIILEEYEKQFDQNEQKLRDTRKDLSVAEATNSFNNEHIQSAQFKLSTNQIASQQQKVKTERWMEELQQLQEEEKSLPRVENLENQIDEYNRIRQSGSSKTAQVDRDLESSVRERDSIAKDLHEAEEAIRRHNETEIRYQEDLDAAERSKEIANEEYTKMSKDYSAIESSFNENKRNIDELNAKQERLLIQRRELNQKIEEANRSKGFSKKVEKQENAIKTMQKLYPGVYGRFSKLVQPSHKRYETALSVACGGFRNAVIVKDIDTAEQCLKYLRDQSIGTLTFIPNDNLIVERPAHLPRGVKLLSHLVTASDSIYQQAVDFVCGDFAYCNDLNEAMNLIHGEKKCSVSAAVTQKGQIVRASGEMEGGSDSQTTEWNVSSADELSKQMEKIENDLKEIATQLINLQSQKESLSDRIEVLKPQLENQKNKRDQYQERIKNLKTYLRVNQRDMNEAETKKKEIENRLNKADNKIREIDLERIQIDAQLFQDFCMKYGVKDVREFEILRLQPFEERYARLFEVQSRISQLQSLLSGSEATDPEERLRRNQEELDEYQEKKKQSQKEVDQLKKTVDKLEEKEKQLREKKDNASDQYQTEMDELSLKRKQYRNVTDQISDIHEKMNEQQNLIDEAKSKIGRNLQQAHMQRIDLPYNEGYMPNISEMPGSFTQANLDATEVDQIIFDELSPALRSITSNTEIEKIIKEYDNKINEKRRRIAGARPDLKSDEKYSNVNDEIKEIEKKKETLQKEAKSAKKEFLELKQKRTDTFMNLYNEIDQSINKIYKLLTKIRKNDRSGTAYLALEDTEEPYLGGIKFTAMPPHKPFRDLEQLSGGEKAIASLALIIALQKQIGAPFILMDEPDSSLDKENLRQAAIALRDLTQADDGPQIIAVSLRHRFFEYSERLFGIYKDTSGSGVASLDLAQFYEDNLLMEQI